MFANVTWKHILGSCSGAEQGSNGLQAERELCVIAIIVRCPQPFPLSNPRARSWETRLCKDLSCSQIDSFSLPSFAHSIAQFLPISAHIFFSEAPRANLDPQHLLQGMASAQPTQDAILQFQGIAPVDYDTANKFLAVRRRRAAVAAQSV